VQLASFCVLLEIRVGHANVRPYLGGGSVAPFADLRIELGCSGAGESVATRSACGGRSNGRALGSGVAPPERAGGCAGRLGACSLPPLEPGERPPVLPRVLAWAELRGDAATCSLPRAVAAGTMFARVPP
jgi:hypothetical protein